MPMKMPYLRPALDVASNLTTNILNSSVANKTRYALYAIIAYGFFILTTHENPDTHGTMTHIKESVTCSYDEETNTVNVSGLPSGIRVIDYRLEDEIVVLKFEDSDGNTYGMKIVSKSEVQSDFSISISPSK